MNDSNDFDGPLAFCFATPFGWIAIKLFYWHSFNVRNVNDQVKMPQYMSQAYYKNSMEQKTG